MNLNETSRPKVWEEGAFDALNVIIGTERDVTFFVSEVNDEIDYAYRFWEDRLYRRVDQCVRYAGRIAWTWLLQYHQRNQDDLIAETMAMMLSRQAKYGHKNILKHGETGVLIRMSDKGARLENMEDECLDFDDDSVVDAWMDIVGYAIIFLMCSADTFILPLELED